MALRVRDIPHTYAEARKLMPIRTIPRYGMCRRISKNGWLVDMGSEIYLKLYETVIVRYFPNGNMYLNCGQFPTVTTQHWINCALSGWIGEVNSKRYTSNGYVSRESVWEMESMFYAGYRRRERLVYYGNGNKYGKVLPYMIRPRKEVK